MFGYKPKGGFSLGESIDVFMSLCDCTFISSWILWRNCNLLSSIRHRFLTFDGSCSVHSRLRNLFVFYSRCNQSYDFRLYGRLQLYRSYIHGIIRNNWSFPFLRVYIGCWPNLRFLCDKKFELQIRWSRICRIRHYKSSRFILFFLS